MVPDFEAALCAGWMGSRTQTVYLAALGLSWEHSHCTGGEVRCIFEMVVLSLGICVPDFPHIKTQFRLLWESYFAFALSILNKSSFSEGSLTMENSEDSW